MKKNRFSVYLPFTYKQIDDFAEFNKTLEKSQIKYFYSALPINAINDNTGYEQNRDYYKGIDTLDDFIKYVEYAINKGFEFIYLLNSSRGFQLDHPHHIESFIRVERLIKKLRDVGCNKIKIGNTQILDYIAYSAPDMDIILSTVLGFKEITQFRRIKEQYPQVEATVLVYDSVKNIPLIKNIQKLGINVKLMVNEGCMNGCPYRHSHDVYPIFDVSQNEKIEENWSYLQIKTFTSNCSTIVKRDLWNYVMKSNIIYPHQIEKYNEAGVYDFKIAGRGEYQIKSGFQDKFIKNYLTMVENPNEYLDVPVLYFNRALWHQGSEYQQKDEQIMLREIKKFLPEISYFAKHGNKCNSDCGFECNYCTQKSAFFKKYLETKESNNGKVYC